jgi:uncharacterized protein YwqG
MLENWIIDLIDKEYPQNKERIKGLLLTTIGFELKGEKPDFTFSRIGGYPPILKNNWPSFEGKPLTFLAQICLGQIAEMNNILPKNGILSFFIKTDDIGSRYPVKKDEFKVIYIQNPAEIEPVKKEIVEIDTLTEREISFFEYYTTPLFQEKIIEKEKITDEELEILDDLESEILVMINQNFETEHQLLGYPRALQGTVNFWWASKYLGIDKDFYSDEEIKLIREEEDNFILLLQVNFGDSKIEIDRFGDSVAYFGIHKDDLKKKNFENVILVMQNT